MVDPRLLGPKTANEILLDRAIRHAVFVARYRTQVGNELLGDLDDLLARVLSKVDSAMADVAGRGFGVTTRNRRRLQRMIVDLGEITGRRYSEIRKSLVAKMQTFAKAEAKFQVAAFHSSLPEGITLGFTVPPASSLNPLLSTRPMLLNGRSGFVSDYFGQMPKALVQDVEGAVNSGLAAGERPAQIANRLTGFQGRGVDGVFGKARRDLMTVARTTTNHVSTQARELTYDENSDLVKGVRFVATLDHRTTPICRSLDGEVFPIDEGERPPMHHQCRSTTVPVLKSWDDLGLGGIFKDASPSTRASLDGQVPADLTYTEWLRGQSRSIQDLALGRGRADLFRSGAIMSMKDLLGPLNRPLTLDQLLQLEGI